MHITAGQIEQPFEFMLVDVPIYPSDVGRVRVL